jgi:hypothetical protein
MGRLLGYALGICLLLAFGAAPAAAQTHVSVGIGVATPYGGGTIVVGRPAAYPYPYRPYAYGYPYPVYPPAYAAPVYGYPAPYYPAYPYYYGPYGGAVVVGGYHGHAHAHYGYGYGHGHGGGHGHGHH